MEQVKKLLSNRYVIWLLLAIPGMFVLFEFFEGEIDFEGVVRESGEFAARFLIVTLCATPLAMIFPSAWITRWLVTNRRYFGVASFGYAALHTVFYLLEEPFEEVAEEFVQFGILTGWLAFFIFIPLAATSTDYAMRSMGRSWKRLQRWVYAAALLIILHWTFVDVSRQEWGPALLHFSPVIILSIYRIWFAQRGNKALEN